MAVILKLPLARIDLADIWDYIAEDNESRADAFIDAIDQKYHVLAEQPVMGRLRDELAEGIRSFPIGQYVIFLFSYQLIESSNLEVLTNP